MPYCEQCGGELSVNATTCEHCGQSLGAPVESEGTRAADPTPSGALLPLTSYIKGGWELFKLYPFGFIGFFLLLIVIAGTVSMSLIFLPIIGAVLPSVLLTPLGVGPSLVAILLIQHQKPQFGDFFAVFKFFLPLAIFGLITGILGLGFQLPISLTLLFLIPFVYLMVSWTFTGILIVDHKLDFWSAMELSRHTVGPYWWKILGFFLLIFLLNLGGLLALGVGLLVTVNVSCCAFTLMYQDLFGIKSTSF